MTDGRPRIGLVHGGAAGVFEQSNEALRFLATSGARVTYIAVNEAGAEFPGALHHWGSLHSDKFPDWEDRRRKNGLPDGYVRWSVCSGHYVDRKVRTFRGGSSGLHAVDIALNGLDLDGAILCGVPMDGRPNAFRGDHWGAFQRFRAAWEKPAVLNRIRGRVRSMSGWTRKLLGAPEGTWLSGLVGPAVADWAADLTERQWEVVELVGGQGMSYKKAARELGIAPGTARKHAEHVRDRLGLDMNPQRALVHLWHHRDQAA